MRLTRLKIIRHRWCAPTELFLGAKRQLVLGKNGTGKTKLLELIAKVCRAVPDELSEEALEVEADFEFADGLVELRVHSDGYDLTGAVPHHTGEPERKYRITGSFTAKDMSRWRSIPTFEVDQDTQHLTHAGRRVRVNSKRPIWPALIELHVDLRTPAWVQHPVAMLATLSSLRRFDEALGFNDWIAKAEVWVIQSEGDVDAIYFQSNDGERWILQGTSADGAAQRRARSIQVKPVPAICTAALLLGYSPDVEVELKNREPIPSQGASAALFDEPEMYFYKREVRIRHAALSFGEKRTISFMAYLNANPHIIIADELMNGLHHSLGVALLNEIGDRQAFLATHEPVLMDEIDFESADELRRSLLLCRRNPDPKGPPFVWTQLSSEEAEEVFPYYPKSLMHGSQILKHWELW